MLSNQWEKERDHDANYKAVNPYQPGHYLYDGHDTKPLTKLFHLNFSLLRVDFQIPNLQKPIISLNNNKVLDVNQNT